jgi:uncharacterized protein
MIHPATELVHIDSVVGLGVIATTRIPAGTIVWAQDPFDHVVSRERFGHVPPLLRPSFTRHSYLDELGSLVLCWDHARFVNHSCAYNCVGAPGRVEIACRDIAIGEQLTNDYAMFGLESHEEFVCACGEPDCRGWIRSLSPNPFARRHADAVVDAVARLQPVESQPLWSLLDRHRAAVIVNQRQARVAIDDAPDDDPWHRLGASRGPNTLIMVPSPRSNR